MTKTLSSILLFLYLVAPCHAATIGLQWDANTDIDLDNYKLYVATFSMLNISTEEATSDGRIQRVEINKDKINIDIPVNAGTTNYFRLSAIDFAGNQSGMNVKIVGGQEMADEVSAFIKRGDINSDGKVNAIDIGILAKDLP